MNSTIENDSLLTHRMVFVRDGCFISIQGTVFLTQSREELRYPCFVSFVHFVVEKKKTG